MNKRFVWNFEVTLDKALELPTVQVGESSDMRWESRLFWPDTEIITLHGLSALFLNLSCHQIKLKNDTYYLLPNLHYNIKVRRNNLFYKPRLLLTPEAQAFGKKLNLHEQHPDSKLPGIDDLDVKALLSVIRKKSLRVNVEKEAITYQFNTTPSAKLELARLTFNNTTYFSLSVESSSLLIVQSITSQLVGECRAYDYVSFLHDTAPK